jgi:hypothetical protein
VQTLARRLQLPAIALVIGLAVAVTPGAHARPAASCSGFINAGGEGGGYVESVRGITCSKAKSIARGALAAGVGANGRYDCEAPKTRHFKGWTIYGPINHGLRYRFRKGNAQFITNKPTECH